ncbi:P-type conjugative transfer protein TrbG [Allosphingosinicella indica]|uniref:Type IV secretion system protein VirB9 n=1 Tax=Allosphingosinicella indica TaxID=941907 RepID=A0A1X7FYX5_9SPHN|nr:P-type conjugative transfer protein TrbG [Allosphingosinicella indica]SMF61206.1 type IV secretion system protein VirB9 [Allosphingosinicella indica]
MIVLAMSLALVTATAHAAQPLPQRGAAPVAPHPLAPIAAHGPGHRVYHPGTVYAVSAAPGAITDIALEPGERLIAVASGDTVRWVIGDTTSGNGPGARAHILVKPVAAGLATNLVVTTDRRVYHLALKSRAKDPAIAISWIYPETALLSLSRPAPPAAPRTELDTLTMDRLRFDYAIEGDRVPWRPILAFDDGRQTYILFPDGITATDAPPLFALGPDGPELVNYRMRGRYYVVDRIFDAAELRLGSRKPKVVRISRAGASAAERRGRK